MSCSFDKDIDFQCFFSLQQKHFSTGMTMEGTNDSFVRQHIPFNIAIDHSVSQFNIRRYSQQADGTNNSTFEPIHHEPVPIGLDINQNFDMTVTYREDGQFEVICTLP